MGGDINPECQEFFITKKDEMKDVCNTKVMSGEMPDGPVYQDCLQNAVNYYNLATRMECAAEYEPTCEDDVDLAKLAEYGSCCN